MSSRHKGVSETPTGARTPGGTRTPQRHDPGPKDKEPTKVRDKSGAPLSSNSIFKHQQVWIRPSAIEPAISDRCVWDSSVFFTDADCEYEDSDMNRAVLSFCYLDHINEDILGRYLPSLEHECTEQGLDHSPRLASPLGQSSNLSDGTPHIGNLHEENDDYDAPDFDPSQQADCEADCDVEQVSAEPSTMVGPSTDLGGQHEFSSVMTDLEEQPSAFSNVGASVDGVDSRELDGFDDPKVDAQASLSDEAQGNPVQQAGGPRRSSRESNGVSPATYTTGTAVDKSPSLGLDAEVQVQAGLVWPHAAMMTPKASSPNRSLILRSVDSIPDQRLQLNQSSDDLTSSLPLVTERSESKKSDLWYAQSSKKRPSKTASAGNCVIAASAIALYAEGAAKVRCAGRTYPPFRRPERARGTPRVRPPLVQSHLYPETNASTNRNKAGSKPAAGTTKKHKADPREVEAKDEMEALLEGFLDPGCEEATAAAAMFLSARVHTKERPGGDVSRGSWSSPVSYSTCATTRLRRKDPNEVCPFGGSMDSAVELRCGHKFSIEYLNEAQNRAKFSDVSGQALICPLCGDQHRYRLDQPETNAVEESSGYQMKVPSIGKRCLSIYSSNTDAYMGDLRQDWRSPLGLPRQMQTLFLPQSKDAMAGSGFR